MPIDLQPKLLRFLENRILTRVGGSTQITVDARILAATNRNPRQLVEKGHMRDDLLYRTSQVTLSVPSLRERKEDIPMLADAFLKRAAASEEKRFRDFEPEVMRILQQYHWPGNVRHLLNVIMGIVVFHDAEAVTVEMLPVDLVQSVQDRQVEQSDVDACDEDREDSREVPFWQIEKTTIQQGLHRHRGNVTELAMALQMSRATLYRRIKRYGISTR